MKNRRKRIIVISSLSIALILAIVFAIIFIPKSITENSYFNSLSRSNFTKQLQTSKIVDNDEVIYEKNEIIVFEKEKAYHKIEEKVVSNDINKDYETRVSEYYYTKNKIYYYEDNVWKTADFNVLENLKTYSLKKEYFSSLTFDKKIESTGTLQGNIKDENVKEVFNSEIDYHSASIEILIDKNGKVQNVNISALTQNERNVTIENQYFYNNETVSLPN